MVQSRNDDDDNDDDDDVVPTAAPNREPITFACLVTKTMFILY